MSSENRRSANQVTVTNDDPKFKIRKQATTQIALAALSHLKYTHTRLSLIFTSDSKIKKINRQFLNHNQPTDVLAFPSGVFSSPFMGEDKGGGDKKSPHPNLPPSARKRRDSSRRIAPMFGEQGGKEHFLGEVIISPKRALIQAPLYEASFQEELARYIAHGILHLAGFKDRTKKEIKQIRKKEDQILKLCRTNIQRLCHSRVRQTNRRIRRSAGRKSGNP